MLYFEFHVLLLSHTFNLSNVCSNKGIITGSGSRIPHANINDTPDIFGPKICPPTALPNTENSGYKRERN